MIGGEDTKYRCVMKIGLQKQAFIKKDSAISDKKEILQPCSWCRAGWGVGKKNGSSKHGRHTHGVEEKETDPQHKVVGNR